MSYRFLTEVLCDDCPAVFQRFATRHEGSGKANAAASRCGWIRFISGGKVVHCCPACVSRRMARAAAERRAAKTVRATEGVPV